MTNRKALLVTYHFPPSGAVAVYRMLGLVRYLPKFGWQPIIVAPPRVPWEPEDASLLTQVPAGTPIERVPFATGFLGKIARYFAPEAHWLLKARSASNRMIREHRPDAIITSSPPGCVHLLGMWLARRHRLPWLACFRDPWIVNRNIANWTLHARFERWMERKVMRNAAKLIANTPLNREGWESAYPDDVAKMVTITNGYDPEHFLPPAEPKPNGKTLSILHAGELYYGRDPRPLLEALEQLKSEPVPVRIEFLGRATEAIYDLRTEIEQRGLGAIVTQIDQLPYAEALDRMMRADILLLIQTPRRPIGVPAKLYEYLGASRPILALAEPQGDIGWVLRESRVLHRIAPATDVPRITQALVELVRAVQAGEPVISDRGALQHFTRERMAQRFAECLDDCVKRTSS